jgi:hypothetical protein
VDWPCMLFNGKYTLSYNLAVSNMWYLIYSVSTINIS